MELKNSLGCKLCKTPLEQCERVKKTSVCKRLGCPYHKHTAEKAALKHEGTFRHQLLQGARAEELDPQAVAARCGHMFHRGCLKKLTTELNTSCIECPICLKPIVLAHLWSIEFYSPESESSSTRHPKTLPAKVHAMNERNSSLIDELTALRRLREHKTMEQRELGEAINGLKQSIAQRSQQLDEKLSSIFGTPTIDSQYEENIRYEKEAILERVKALTRRNTELLSTIEERAKQHYANEGDRPEGDSYLQTIQGKIKEQEDRLKLRAEANQVMPARIMKKPVHVPPKKPELNMDELLKCSESHPTVGHTEISPPAPDDQLDVRPQRSMEVNLSAAGRQTPDDLTFSHLPLAAMTRSMQELFEQQRIYHEGTVKNRCGLTILESGDCGDGAELHDLMPVRYFLPSPPGGVCDECNAQISAPCELMRPERATLNEAKDEDELSCWNERFRHIRNRAAERQKNAPRLLTTKPLKLRLSKTNLRRKKSGKTSYNGSPLKTNFALNSAQQQQFQRWCRALPHGGGDASGSG